MMNDRQQPQLYYTTSQQKDQPTNQPRNCTADQPQQEPPRGAYDSLYGLYRIHHKHTTLEFQLLRHYYHDSRPPSV